MRIPRNWHRPAIDALLRGTPSVYGRASLPPSRFPPGPAKASPSRELISFALRIDRQREGLCGVGGHAVGGIDRQRADAGGGGRRDREGGGPVAEVRERHARG